MDANEGDTCTAAANGEVGDNCTEPAATFFLVNFENTFARLPSKFYQRISPSPVRCPRVLKVNHELADLLGIEEWRLLSDEGAAILGGNAVPLGATPLAMVYGGHQFNSWNPSLGDGRAILLGEVRTAGSGGELWDMQLKGCGRTAFSRMGDGRAPLGPIIREYVVSEAMAGLGVPTTRALAIVTTGEFVERFGKIEKGAVLTRVSRNLIRFGTFQYFAWHKDRTAIRQLADYVIERHYVHIQKDSKRYRSFLGEVVKRQAELMAKWQSLGFIHGVMNTDNMSMTGDTIDYGPCAFMDTYKADTCYSYIDSMRIYSFDNQPRVAFGNLCRLASALLPILAESQEEAMEEAKVVSSFFRIFNEAYLKEMRGKLGLRTQQSGDEQLIQELLCCMEDNKADFTLTFRHLSDVTFSDNGDTSVDDVVVIPPSLRRQFDEREEGEKCLYAWCKKWKERVSLDRAEGASGVCEAERRNAMRAVNPAFIPRNHVVNGIIAAAEEDITNINESLESLMIVLRAPFDDHDTFCDRFGPPTQSDQIVLNTFCGT